MSKRISQLGYPKLVKIQCSQIQIKIIKNKNKFEQETYEGYEQKTTEKDKIGLNFVQLTHQTKPIQIIFASDELNFSL